MADDGRCALISFISSPLVVNRENVYVLFVTNPNLASSAHSYEWDFSENSSFPITQTTQSGQISYNPRSVGSLELVVRVLSAGGVEQARLTLSQSSVAPNANLEALVSDAIQDTGPTIANLEVARELVNDNNPYYQYVEPQSHEAGDGFQRFVFSMASDGALQRTAERRREHINQLAESLNGKNGRFATLAAEGVGLCAVRLALLAMTLPKAFGTTVTMLNWTELPQSTPQRIVADEQLHQMLAKLDEAIRLDLFNLARFPRSNIAQCGRILEMLRDRYFNGTPFDEILSGFSGTRAHWIAKHYREGPLLIN